MATKPIFLRPSMGSEADSYKVLANVVSEGGAIRRRPCIRAVEAGYTTTFTPTPFATTDDGKGFGPQWRVLSYTANSSFAATQNITFVNYPAGLTALSVGAGSNEYNSSITLTDSIGSSVTYSFFADVSPSAGTSYPNSRYHGQVVGTTVYVGVPWPYASVPAVEVSRSALVDAINNFNGITNKQYPPLRVVAAAGSGGTFSVTQLVEGTPGNTSITYNSDAASNLVFGVSPPSTFVAGSGTLPTLTLEIPGGLVLTGSNVANHIGTTNFVEFFDKTGAGADIIKAWVKTVSLSSSGREVSLSIGQQFTSSSGFKHMLVRDTNFWSAVGDLEIQDTRQIYSSNVVLEGIDCEIIEGNIVTIYLGRDVVSVASTTSSNMYFHHSFHHVGDPRIGNSRTLRQYGTIKDDSPKNWYNLARYWDKRITPTFSDYMITGRAVGPELTAGEENLFTRGGIQFRGDSASLFSGFQTKMFADNDFFMSAIPRSDPFSTIYCLHIPTNAFAHTERQSGQTIWYGFIDGDLYELLSEIPADTILVMAADSDIPTQRDTIYVRPYDVWYSEPANPLSLSVVGLFPLNVGSRSPEIVGMADFRTGTAIFSHDMIHFMRGIGADTSSNAASRLVLNSGIGADSRWSIESVGSGVAFANENGLFFLAENGSVNEVRGFSDLFSEEGADCGRGPSHPYLSGTATGKHSDDGSNEGNADKTDFDTAPWTTYKVDKSRLDRAVAGVWGGLYLLFVSMDGHEVGDDNRLCLCWNWKESTPATTRSAWSPGPASVWLLPKNMGVRGWAYDGKIKTPYVMTRYGLARFEDSPMGDRCWTNEGPTNSGGAADANRIEPFERGNATYSNQGYGWRSTINATEPMPIIMGQTRWLPESGDGFVTTNVIVQHETKNDHKLASAESWSYTNDGDVSGVQSYTGGDKSNDINIRIFGAQSDLLLSKGSEFVDAYGKMSFSESKIHALQNFMQREDFKAWRGRHARHNDTNEFPGSTDNDGTARVPAAIRRASSGRAGFQSSRCAVQFSTSATGKIMSVQIIMNPVTPRGERA